MTLTGWLLLSLVGLLITVSPLVVFRLLVARKRSLLKRFSKAYGIPENDLKRLVVTEEARQQTIAFARRPPMVVALPDMNQIARDMASTWLRMHSDRAVPPRRIPSPRAEEPRPVPPTSWERIMGDDS